ncbi:MAG: hypothetical protein OHK0012_05240 [Synechococcales cyanobacterium]
MAAQGLALAQGLVLAAQGLGLAQGFTGAQGLLLTRIGVAGDPEAVVFA